ncbi:MAG: flippase-like domain-containing protein, partial [Pseudomonadota bacterium]
MSTQQDSAHKSRQNITLPSRRTLSLSLMIAAAFYMLMALAAGWTEIASAIARLGTGGWLLILACSLSNYLLRFGRWQYYMRVLGHRIPVRLHLTYYMAGFALTTTPGKAGETIRSLYLKPHGVRYSESLASFFTER